MEDIIYDNQVLHLTKQFYEAYPSAIYREILRKTSRPYNCLLIQSNYDYFICIPYRTEIKHDYAYKFTSSSRSREHNSGLDYTKIVIISNNDYIDASSALIDQDEYRETMQNLDRIVREAKSFVDDYVLHCSEKQLLHTSEFRRRYQFSPLKYFHRELSI